MLALWNIWKYDVSSQVQVLLMTLSFWLIQELLSNFRDRLSLKGGGGGTK